MAVYDSLTYIFSRKCVRLIVVIVKKKKKKKTQTPSATDQRTINEVVIGQYRPVTQCE